MKENLQCTSKYGHLRISQDICHVRMTDIEGFLTIYGHSDNLLNNKYVYMVYFLFSVRAFRYTARAASRELHGFLQPIRLRFCQNLVIRPVGVLNRTVRRALIQKTREHANETLMATRFC